MSSFNNKQVSAKLVLPSSVNRIVRAKPDTRNKAGGKAFSLTNEYKLAFSLVASFLEPEFYRDRKQAVKEIEDLVAKVDPLFAAKAAVLTRTTYGNRSTTHLVAAVIAYLVKGETWTKNFFNKVVYRVDDASEIMAAYLGMYGKPVPNSLKKGLAKAMSKFSTYQLAKYKGENKGVKLVDLFNIVHPKPSEENATAFKNLIEGNLASEGTWEAMLSAAGQTGTPAEKEKAKKKVWKTLLETNKLGYFALLKNLRNIMQTGDEGIVDLAAKQLVNKDQILKSLVLPFRYLTAQKELEKTQDPFSRTLLKAVNDALDIAMSNVPVFPGKTLVALDRSGSMGQTSDPSSPASIGSLFAAVIAKANNADLMVFDDKADNINVNLSDSLFTVTKGIQAHFTYGGTDFGEIFRKATRKYDRIIILSDMQAWIGGGAPTKEFGEYCSRTNARPKLYSFDLQGLGTIQFPQENVYALAGFSEKTMDIMKMLEVDPQAFITQINAIEL